MPRRIRLTREEQEIEAALLRGEYVDVPRREFQKFRRMVERSVKRHRPLLKRLAKA